MHEIDEQQADRFLFDAGSIRSDLPRTAETHTGAPGRTAERVAVRVLAHDHDRHAAVLCVRGEIDLGTAPVLREALSWVLQQRTGPVVVDLSEVSFMDSTGLHVLVDTLELLRLEDRRLAIACREGGQVHRVLALLGLLDALTVCHSRESAVIGGDDRLRSAPGRDHPRYKPPALAQNLISGQLTEC